MADIAAGRTAKPAIGLGLEGKQSEDMIDIAKHRARPAGPPRPDRGRYVVDDRDGGIAGPNAPRHPVGEIGAVDDDENVRRCLRHRIRGLADAPQDHRQLLHDRRQAHDRQFFDRKQRRQPLARHRLAADTFKPHRAAEALAQHLHQAGAQPITGFLGRNQKDMSRDGVCVRRHHAGSPVTKRPAASAVSIMAWGSTTMVLPAMIAIPPSPALTAPSTVRGPTVGRSKRKSCPLLGAFTSTPRAALARIRPSARSRVTRANKPSVPSISSTPTTWPSITTAAWPMSKGLSARSTSRPLAISAAALSSGATRVMHPSGISRSGATSLIPTIRKPSCSRMRPMPDKR